MYGTRLCNEYLNGVNQFLCEAKQDKDNKGTPFIYCPCKDCKNEKKLISEEIVREHLIVRGFKENYTCWNKHGEVGTNEGEVEDHIDDQEHDPNIDLTDILGLSDNEVMDRVENLDEMVRNVERHDEEYSDGELARYKRLIEDSRKPLYPGCDVRHTRLNIIIRLLQLKASNGWSDNSFRDLLGLLQDILPKDNLIPTKVYEAKQIICPLGLEVEKIHACKNDCILYHGEEYDDLDRCPECGLERFKRKKDGNDEQDGSHSGK